MKFRRAGETSPRANPQHAQPRKGPYRTGFCDAVDVDAVLAFISRPTVCVVIFGRELNDAGTFGKRTRS